MPSQHVDWVNPVNWDPLAVALGWPQASHVGGGRRHVAGDAKHGKGPRTSSDFAYGQPFRAREGAFERAEQRASNSGGGLAGNALKRWRRTPRWSPELAGIGAGVEASGGAASAEDGNGEAARY